MRKTLFITLGILTLLMVIGIWAYLFMYGTPKNPDEVFARFGIGGNEEIIPVALEDTRIDVTSESAPNVPKRLRQLTTRPVAGAAFDLDGIRYVEQGTGHIYHINLSTGEETLVSGTTIPHTTQATFSQDSSMVAITSRESSGNTTVVGTIVTNEVTGGFTEGITLPAGAREIAFGDATGTVNYLLTTNSGSASYAYNLNKKTSAQLFAIPLRDVHVLWGSPAYVYTTPTAFQNGYLYKISGNELVYTTGSGSGLVAFRYSDGVVSTKTDGGKLVTTAQTYSGIETPQAFSFIPEKCVANPNQNSFAFCGVSNSRNTEVFPDDWYKGKLSYSDALWYMDITTGAATPLSDFKTESGREIDVIQIGTNTEGTFIWFVNKNDNALWMFDTTL